MLYQQLLVTHAVRLADSHGDTLLLFSLSGRHTPSSVCCLQSTHDFLFFVWRHMPTDPTHGPIPTHGELFVVVSWRHTQQAFLTCREILLLLGNHTQRVFGDTQPEFFLCIFIGDLHLLPLLIAIGNTCRNLLNLVVVAHLQTRSSSSSNCPTYGSIALHRQHMLEFLSKL